MKRVTAVLAMIVMSFAVMIAVSSCSKKYEAQTVGTPSSPAQTPQQNPVDAKEKIARALANPEFGCIYLYLGSNNTYTKQTPQTTNNINISKPANDTIIYFIAYDSKDPRELYAFYHFPVGADGKIGIGYYTGAEEMTPSITPFDAGNGNRFYVMEIPGMYLGSIYGIKSRTTNQVLQPVVLK